MSEISKVNWQWRHFDNQTPREWHEILQLRSAVFVVEQTCPYQDPDGKDPLCFHLSARVDGNLAGTLRAVPPGLSYAESSIGRVVIDPAFRGLNLGRHLMERGIAFNKTYWGGPIKIGAQAYLEAFYGSLGFETCSEPYDEDGIPHLLMTMP